MGSFALPYDNEDVLEQALALVRAGVPVFPVHGLRSDGECTCGDRSESHLRNRGKHPATGHGHLDATLDEFRVTQWFKDGGGGESESRLNVAFPTGAASGLVALDVDVRHGGDRTLEDWYAWVADVEYPPPTLRCRTGGGGLHILYRVPPGVRVTSRQSVLPGVDVKGDGGYVVTAPSRHVSGERYRWLDPERPVSDVPPDLLRWLITARGTAGGAGNGGGGVAAAVADSYSFEQALAEGCPAGARDTFFNDLAFRCKMTWNLTQGEALTRVRHHWERAEQSATDPFTWDEAAYKVLRVYADESLRPSEPDPRYAEIAARLTAQVVAAGSTVRATAPEPAAEASEGEVAESGAPLGSSGQAESQDPPGTSGGRGPAVLGEPPNFDADLTHTGNAHRLVRLFGEQIMYVSGLGWHVWDGTRWLVDERNVALHLTQGVLQLLRREQVDLAGNPDAANRVGRFYEASSQDRARTAMLKLAAADPRVTAVVGELDADPWLLVVANGTLDLRTGTLRESRPADRCTRRAAVAYDPGADCPEWRRHIELITSRASGASDPDLAAYVQRWVGYSLTGSVAAEKFFFGFGEGSNGKNVLIETVLDMLGDYGRRLSAKIFDDREHDTVLADLAGARMIFIDETVKRRVNDGRLKQLTGSSRIRARKIAKDSFEFAAHFKLWLAGNHKPRVDDASEGFWRRLELVPFDVVIPAERRVPNYAELLRTEWSGILNWALEGLRAYRELGGLGAPARVATATAEYRVEENWFGQFVSDTFDEESTQRVWLPNKIIMRLLTAWCHAQGITRVPTMMQLTKGELPRAGFTNDPKKRRVAVWPSGVVGPERGWVGPPTLPGVLGDEIGKWYGSGTGSGTEVTGL